MAFSPAAKVGLVTLLSIGALGAGLGWLTSLSFGKTGYDFTVTYKDVAGLTPGAAVMLMGVRVGKIIAIETKDRLVLVHAHIFSPNTHVEQNGRFMLMSQGIVGDKSLEIFPPKQLAAPAAAESGTVNDLPASPTPIPTSSPEIVYLKDGATVRGDDPQRIEMVMEELSDTFNDFKKGTDPKKFQEMFAKTADNLAQTAGTIRRIGDKAETLIGGFDSTPKQINDMVASIRAAADSTNKLVGGANPADLQAAVANLRTLSTQLLGTYHELFAENRVKGQPVTSLTRSVRSLAGQLDHLATTLNNTAGDPKVQADLRDTIKNIRLLTQGLSGAANIANPKNTIGSFSFEPRVDALAVDTPDGNGLAANLGLRVNFAGNYALGELEQVGSGNYLDASFGRQDAWHGLGYQIGLIRSKIGVGVDYGPLDTVRLSGELYDTFNPTLRLGVTYFPLVGGQYGLTGQYARTFDQSVNYFWAGVEWRPQFGTPQALIGPPVPSP